MPTKKLPKYGECEYSVFVSYAHADNKANNQWVLALKEAIWERLNNLRKDVTRLTIHLSELDGPVAGELGEELQERIAKSFAMLLVVGAKYQEANWCEKELQMFSELFGEQGRKERLLIAAMSEPAIKHAEAGAVWQNTLGKEQVWVRMFREQEPAKPLAPRSKDAFAEDFWEQAEKLADRLIAEIEKDYTETVSCAAAPGVSKDEKANTPWSQTRHHQLRVAIAPCTRSLVASTTFLASALELSGAHVTALERSVIDDYVPDTGAPLRELLCHYDVLVAPISSETPLRPDRDGGHAVILQDEWRRAKQGPGIIWYKPADTRIPSENMAADRHQGVLSALSPICASEQAVLSLLFGVNAGAALRVYIEKHPQEASYYRLARKLKERWDELVPADRRPRLQCALLDLNKLDKADKSAVGIVLLYPWGVKDPDSLAGQQKQVMDSIPKKGPTYPGCVAVISTTPPKDVPLHDWPTVNFGRYDNEPKLMIDPGSEVWLSEFLNDIWIQYQSDLPH